MRVEAFSFFEDPNKGLCENYPSDDVLELLQSLKDVGIKHIDVEIEDDGDLVGNLISNGTLYLTLPKYILPELLVRIGHIRPDEISEEEDGTIRIWWD